MYQNSNYIYIAQALLQLAQQAHDDPAYIASTGQMKYVDPTVQTPTDATSSTRNATKLWEVPSQLQIMSKGGPPFLALRFGHLAGYGLGGVLESADMAAKGPSATEPYWDWELYSIHPYDETDPNYSDAAQDMTMLMQLFNAPENAHLPLLNPNPLGVTAPRTAQDTYVADATPAYLELMDGTPYSCAYLVIRTSEFLTLD